MQLQIAGGDRPVAFAWMDVPSAKKYFIAKCDDCADHDFRIVVLDESAIRADKALHIVAIGYMANARAFLFAGISHEAYSAGWPGIRQGRLAAGGSGLVCIAAVLPQRANERPGRMTDDDPEELYEQADVHYYAGRLDEAEVLYHRILEIDPAHQGALHSIGIVRYDQDDYPPAIRYFLKALDVDPTDQYVHSNLGKALYGLHHAGSREDAVVVARQWLADYPDNPIAAHMVAAVTGADMPDRANAAYVRKTFDEFADSFENKLEELEYRAPALIVEAMSRYFSRSKGLHILDAGCGTGLCGPLLKPMAKRLDGIDLSGEMLAIAKKKKLYSRLDKGDLNALLVKKKQQYDAVIAADVLCYFGDLTEVLTGFHAALKPGGLLGFSVQQNRGKAKYLLESSGRYCHAKAYAANTLEALGFSVLVDSKEVLRTEYGNPVSGRVLVARKPD